MSVATKKKYVRNEILEEDFSLPEENQQIVYVMRSPGNNLYQVEASDGSTFLVSMPQKFRKTIWVRTGLFVLIEPIVEGVKVKGEMVRILTDNHIKFLKANNCWPEEFDSKLDRNRHWPWIKDTKNDENGHCKKLDENQSDSEQDDDLFVNTNRPPPILELVSDSSSDLSSESENEDE